MHEKRMNVYIRTMKNYLAAMVPSAWFLAIFIAMLLPVDVAAGTYMSTKHGTDADRRVFDGGFPYTTKGLCAHCHDQHSSIDGTEPFPHVNDNETDYVLFRSNYGADRNELCFECHETFSLAGMTLGYGQYGIYQGKTKYNDSIHYSDPNMEWNGSSPPGPPFSASSTLLDAGNCHNCHNPHGYDDGSGLIPQMLFARDSKTGDSPAYEMGCEACHGTPPVGSAEDIEVQLDKTYAHPTHDYNDRHILPETGESEGGDSFGNPPTYDKRHAECVDCHNPHTVVSDALHVEKDDGNAVSDVLKYVWGVEPAWPGTGWTQPTSFTVRKPPTYQNGSLYEYQICFKCHSYYGLGTLANGVTTIIGPSGDEITDQAWEFNRNNRSAHPVVGDLSTQSGSSNPRALTAAQMSAPWTSVGTQTMYCSDCHGADNESTGAKGPHGSIRKFMLKGSAQYWPTKTDGSTPWTLDDLGGVDAGNNLFCTNCHANDRTQNSAHNAPSHRAPVSTVQCVECHVAVPHGSKRSRLIGYTSDPAPYDYNNSSLKITEVVKPAGGPNAYVIGSCRAAACHANHANPVVGAEP